MHTALVLLVTAALLLPLVSYGEPILPQTQHAVVTNLGQLEDDKALRQYRDTYPALSAANLIYAKCGKELDVSDSDQEYLKTKFDNVSKGYVNAYQHAYVEATNAAPPQSFMNDVVKALTARQQDAVDNVALIIRQRGCNDGRLRAFVKYVDSMRKQDKKLANAKPAVPAQPYQ